MINVTMEQYPTSKRHLAKKNNGWRPFLISINKHESNDRQYTWDIGTKLKSIIDKVANVGLEYSYDNFGNPTKPR